jgi:hypothetical protein
MELTSGDSSAIFASVWPKQRSLRLPLEAEVDQNFAKGARTLDEASAKIVSSLAATDSRNLPFIYTPLQNSLSALRNRFGNIKPTSYAACCGTSKKFTT